MGETTVTKPGTPQTQSGQSSDGGKGSTSQQTPDTYSKEQALKLISDALAEQGRKHKAELEPILKEREGLRSQLQGKENELKDVVDEREKLDKQIKELTSNDPEAFNLIKKDKELREQERKLKVEVQALETDKQVHGERVKLAEDTLREISIWDISAEYDTGDPIKLKDLCDVFTANSEEQIRKIADTLWVKKTEPAPPASSPVKPYSGMTSGGGIDINSLTPDEKLKEGFRRAKQK